MLSQNIRLLLSLCFPGTVYLYFKWEVYRWYKADFCPRVQLFVFKYLKFQRNLCYCKMIQNKSLASFQYFLKYGNCIWALNLLTDYFHNCFLSINFHFLGPIELYIQIETWKKCLIYWLDQVCPFVLHLNFQFIRVFCLWQFLLCICCPLFSLQLISIS